VGTCQGQPSVDHEGGRGSLSSQGPPALCNSISAGAGFGAARACPPSSPECLWELGLCKDGDEVEDGGPIRASER
jgi:hypothetical protein